MMTRKFWIPGTIIALLFSGLAAYLVGGRLNASTPQVRPEAVAATAEVAQPATPDTAPAPAATAPTTPAAAPAPKPAAVDTTAPAKATTDPVPAGKPAQPTKPAAPAQAPAPVSTPSSAPAAAEPAPVVRPARLVELTAEGCGACKMMAPVLEALRTDYAGKLMVEVIDANLQRDLAAPYGARFTPTQVFFDADGKEIFRHVGYFAKDAIIGKFRELGVTL